ncbi:MAG: OmpH family outer membrane protein [Bacteroidales bacterium]|nr:OmpH family outer membrane protein [Bacteroidales bacterium]MCR5245437.1 OmpH family outer membrane protein [Bacteroidales bacterium]
MKRTLLFLGIIAAMTFVSCNQNQGATAQEEEKTESTAPGKGQIVYFNLDKVLNEYDMANDLRSVVETKIKGINDEVNRRGNKLDSDIKSFQDKIDKGLMTRSTAEVQSADLQKRQQSFQTYAAQKQQEIAEEQQVMLNQLADAIKTFLDKYNAEKHFAMILTTQGDILPAPIAAADSSLDVTDDILAGLNAEYVKTKGQSK